MQRCANRGGDSNVAAFEYGTDFIRVEFNDGSIYRYTNASAGASNIQRMQQLTDQGVGLNSFINTHVRKRHEIRER